MTKNKVAIFSSDMVQDHEFVYPFFRILEENIELDVFMHEGKNAKGILGMPIPPNKDYKVYDIIDFKPDEYAMIVLPGGVKSMEKLRLNDRLIKIIRDFDNNDKLIASICSAAQLLISADIIKDRKISAYYSMKQDVINAGAEFIDSPFVVDKNIISSPHYKYVNFWIKKAIEKYKEKISV